jgi:hypothetical protein
VDSGLGVPSTLHAWRADGHRYRHWATLIMPWIGVAFSCKYSTCYRGTLLCIEAISQGSSTHAVLRNFCLSFRHANYYAINTEINKSFAQYIYTQERKKKHRRVGTVTTVKKNHARGNHRLPLDMSSLRSNRSRRPSRRRRTTSIHGRGQKQRHVGHAQRHGGHSDLQVGWGGGGGGLRGRLAQPALDGEDDGCPADHFVAGEDLGSEVS